MIDEVALIELALSYHGRGDLDQAESIYRRILGAHPTEPDALHLLGVLLYQRGDAQAGVRYISEAIQIRPGSAPFHNNLGAAYRALNDITRAEEAFSAAVTLSPGYVDARSNRARLLAATQRIDDARDEFDELVALCPDHPEFLCDRAEVIEAQGRPQEALQEFHRIAEMAPTYARGIMRLGMALNNRGNTDQSIRYLQRAIEIDGASVDAFLQLGMTLQKADRLDEAEEAYLHVLKIDQLHGKAHGHLGILLHQKGSFEEAAEHYWKAVDANPNDVSVFNNLGTLYQDHSQNSEAATFYRMALQIEPEHPGALANLGSILHGQGLLDEAETMLRKCLEVAPEQVEAHSNLGGVQQARGEFSEAISSYRRALQIRPDHALAHSNLIFALDMDPAASAASVFSERRAFNNQHAIKFGSAGHSWTNDRSPDRQLRVGYISADFRHHSAASTFMPVLLNHDPKAVDVICYSGVLKEDEITEKCRALASEYRSTVGVSDDDLARQIREDAVDILVDLSGYSSGHRLLVLARKPAPIIVTAWGHAVGTGLGTVDYFFGDEITVPPSVARYFREQVVNLPSIVPFLAPEPSPDVSHAPSLVSGHITFGSLNRTHKVTNDVIALWSAVLQAVPDSHFFLKYAGLDKAANQSRFLAAFAEHGIGSERISFAGASSRFEHLASYSNVDIALDPFPHGGGVTALEGLWMGVPLITLLGDGVPGRLSASFLTTLGHTELIAADRNEYVQRAHDLAVDTSRLTHLRSSLRESMLDSIICNGELYCRSVEAAYRAMWQTWCNSPQRLA